MEHLRELRAKRKLIQRDVAEALEIDRTTYAKYETGDSEPSFEILKRIALFYEVSIDYLLDFNVNGQKTKKGPSEILTDEEKDLLESFRAFNRKGREKILEEIYIMNKSGIYKNSDNLSGLEIKEAP